jgi:hypothetical protein
MIGLPLVAWIIHLISRLPLTTLFGIQHNDVRAYFYFSLCGVYLSAVIVVLYGLVTLDKQRKYGKQKTQIILLMIMWVILPLLYLYLSFLFVISKVK